MCRKQPFLRPVACAVLLVLSGCAGLQEMAQGLPPNSTERGRFVTAQGQQAMIEQLPGADSYALFVPNTQLAATTVAALDGQENLLLAGTADLGEQTALLTESSSPTCAAQYTLVLADLPGVRSLNLPGCNATLTMLLQQDGQSIGMRDADSVPPYYYIYRGGDGVYGPIYERRIVHRSHVNVAQKAQPAAPASQSSAPVDLDNLALPANTNAVNLDK